MAVNDAVLSEPFTSDFIRERQGSRGMKLSYVEAFDVKKRIIDATDNSFSFEVLSCHLHPGGDKDFWVVHCRLTLQDRGSRDAVGTALFMNEDSPKSAVTDAFKVAASLFGVALDLYDTEWKPMPTPSAPPVAEDAKKLRLAALRRAQDELLRVYPNWSTLDNAEKKAEIDHVRGLNNLDPLSVFGELIPADLQFLTDIYKEHSSQER